MTRRAQPAGRDRTASRRPVAALALAPALIAALWAGRAPAPSLGAPAQPATPPFPTLPPTMPFPTLPPNIPTPAPQTPTPTARPVRSPTPTRQATREPTPTPPPSPSPTATPSFVLESWGFLPYAASSGGLEPDAAPAARVNDAAGRRPDPTGRRRDG